MKKNSKKNSDKWWEDIPIDNGTLHVYIKTPKGWKCKKKGCNQGFKHTHSTYKVFLNG